jgi:hypothetical protein
MKRVPMIVATIILTAGLTACGGKHKPAAVPTTGHLSPSATTSLSGSPSPHHAAASPSGGPKAAVVTIDPCQLVTQQEASQMANTSFGPGKEEVTKVRHTCVYGAQTSNVLMVIVLQGATVGDAQAEWDQLLAEAKSAAGQEANLIHLTPDPGIGDRAEWAELDLAQIGVSGRGLAFLKGPVGVYMIDVARGGSAPTRDAMTTQAQSVLGRLP